MWQLGVHAQGGVASCVVSHGGIPFGWVGPCSMSWLQDQLQKAKAQGSQEASCQDPASCHEGQGPHQQGPGQDQEGHVQGQGEDQKVRAPEWPSQAEVFLSKKEKIQDVLEEVSGCAAAQFAAKNLEPVGCFSML